MVSAHPVVILEMADHRLDGGATPHLAADDLGNPAGLAADPDLEPIGIFMAARRAWRKQSALWAVSSMMPSAGNPSIKAAAEGASQ